MDIYLQTVNLINTRAKVARNYGTPHKIYQAEIHTLEAIVDNPEVNASSLSERLSITNGALTQVVAKLVKKGLLITYNKSDNKREVYYSPTELGLQADRQHRLYDMKLFKEKFGFLENMSEEERQIIFHFFMEVKKGLLS